MTLIYADNSGFSFIYFLSAFFFKANVSKVTAKVQKSITKAVKTVKKLANPKTIREKTRAVVKGVKATMNTVKKTVSGDASKAEKFTGTAKLGLLAAAKTAKGAMVKYAVPAANKIVFSTHHLPPIILRPCIPHRYTAHQIPGPGVPGRSP